MPSNLFFPKFKTTMAPISKSSKKRAAPTEDAPKAKKQRTEKTKADKPEKKRSKPITQTQPADSSDSDEGNWEDLERDGDDDVSDGEAKGEEEGKEKMDVDEASKPKPKDPNGAHLVHLVLSPPPR